MSRHVGRKDRWEQRGAKTYVSALGPVEYRRGAWYARLQCRVREGTAAGELPVWVLADRWLGPFKRPRDAMVALEREVTALQNRHGQEFEIGLGDFPADAD
jgi:hypothetical protein